MLLRAAVSLTFGYDQGSMGALWGSALQNDLIDNPEICLSDFQHKMAIFFLIWLFATLIWIP